MDSARGSVLGTTEMVVVNGSASFTDLIFKGTPGSTGVEFIISSKSINNEQVRVGKGLGADSTPDQVLKLIDFRLCQSGEIIFGDQ